MIRGLFAQFVVSVTLVGCSWRRVASARVVVEDGDPDEAGMWDVFGSHGPQYTDVRQGRLGDCWLLASLAAIAHRHPHIIERLFVKRSLWDQARPVYTIALFLNGERTEVAVDDLVPALSNEFAFSRVGDEGHIWPALVEKGLAKAYGSYHDLNEGYPYDAFKAITQAPVSVFDTSQGDIWDVLAEAERSRWPVAANSWPNNLGAAAYHSFVILRTDEGAHGKVVQVYNPWSVNKYSGQLANDTDAMQGTYWLTFEEFQTVFHSVYVAFVQSHYQISSLRVESNRSVALGFTMTGNSPFALQVEWPETRFLPTHCSNKLILGVVVSKADNLQDVHLSALQGSTLFSNDRVDLPGGAGEYVVYISSDILNAKWMESIVVNIYADEEVTISVLSREPRALAASMFGIPFACNVFYDKTDGDTFRMMPHTTNGFPSWEGSAFKHVLWRNSKMGWILSPAANATDRYYDEFVLSDLSCESASALMEEQVATRAESRVVQNPGGEVRADWNMASESCGARLARLRQLDALSSFATTSDAAFPATSRSIGGPGSDCGDGASGQMVQCSVLDHWVSIEDLMRTNTMAKSLVRRCLGAKRFPSRCALINTCGVELPVDSLASPLHPYAMVTTQEFFCDTLMGEPQIFENWKAERERNRQDMLKCAVSSKIRKCQLKNRCAHNVTVLCDACGLHGGLLMPPFAQGEANDLCCCDF